VSEIQIVCENGERRSLKDTYLRTKDLKLYSFPDLSFLPIDDPDSYRWHFLKDLGVTTQVNALFLSEASRAAE